MAVIHFIISFFGKLVFGTAVISAIITAAEIILYMTGNKGGPR